MGDGEDILNSVTMGDGDQDSLNSGTMGDGEQQPSAVFTTDKEM
jgi:hypothetical protein